MVRGQLVILDQQGKEMQGEENTIKFMFNPQEYTISRSVDWGNKSNDTSDAGNKIFNGGNPATLQLDLFFDTYGTKNGDMGRQSDDKVEDVRNLTHKLWELTEISPGTSHKKSGIKKETPRQVLFQWGKSWHFKAVVKKLDQQFTLFMPDGMPVRAKVKLTLEQSDASTQFYGSESQSYDVREGLRKAGVDIKALGSRDLRKLEAARGST